MSPIYRLDEVVLCFAARLYMNRRLQDNAKMFVYFSKMYEGGL